MCRLQSRHFSGIVEGNVVDFVEVLKWLYDWL
nr:MAG TPA: protein of unknown function DUF3412 [Caudoviricetes sp.]